MASHGIRAILSQPTQISGVDVIKFHGTAGQQTITFWITRDALEKLANNTPLGPNLVDAFEPLKAAAWAAADRKYQAYAAQGVAITAPILIEESDV